MKYLKESLKLLKEDDIDAETAVEQEPEFDEDDLGDLDFQGVDITAGADKVCSGSKWDVYKPKNLDGMILLSTGTKWLSPYKYNHREMEYDQVDEESWTTKNWPSAYVFINKQDENNKFLFCSDWAGVYSPRFARYSAATWIFKQNDPKLNKWAIDQGFKYTSTALKKKAGGQKVAQTGTYVYPTDMEPAHKDKSSARRIEVVPGTKQIKSRAFGWFPNVTTIELPDSVEKIGSYAFCSSGIKEIKIPSKVKILKEGTFSYCYELEKVILPDGLQEIQDRCFTYCGKLKEIFIPLSVTKMGRRAFDLFRNWAYRTETPPDPNSVKTKIYCEAPEKPDGWAEDWLERRTSTYNYRTGTWDTVFLNGIEIIWGASRPQELHEDENGEDDIGDIEFVARDNPTKVKDDAAGLRVVVPLSYDEFLSYYEGQSVERIRDIVRYNFEGNASTTRNTYVILDNNDNSVGTFIAKNKDYFGENCARLSSQDFARYVVSKSKKIAKWFKNTFSASKRDFEVALNQQDFLDRTGGVWTYTTDSFLGDERVVVKKVIFPEGMTEIPAYACSRFWGLEEVEIPESVTKIGSLAFGECKTLKNIVLHESIKSIGNAAFKYSGLEEIKIPNDITEIPEECFAGCNDLKRVQLPNNLKKICKDAFFGCSGIETLDIPEGTTEIAKQAFTYGRSLTKVHIPASVTTIGDFAFSMIESPECIIYCDAESKPEGWSNRFIYNFIYNKEPENIVLKFGEHITEDIDDSDISDITFETDNLDTDYETGSQRYMAKMKADAERHGFKIKFHQPIYPKRGDPIWYCKNGGIFSLYKDNIEIYVYAGGDSSLYDRNTEDYVESGQELEEKYGIFNDHTLYLSTSSDWDDDKPDSPLLWGEDNNLYIGFVISNDAKGVNAYSYDMNFEDSYDLINGFYSIDTLCTEAYETFINEYDTEED